MIGDFDRPNIFLSVRRAQSVAEKRQHLARTVTESKGRDRLRGDARRRAGGSRQLASAGERVTLYHAGLSAHARQDGWRRSSTARRASSGHGDVRDGIDQAGRALGAPGLPTLCVGLRGMIYTELEVRGAKTDLHSGMYGGAAPNPFTAIAQIIAHLKDENGHILIPGFYDDIIPPSPEELAAWRSLPFDEEHYRIAEVGSSQLVGENGYSVLERTWARPTLDVHGIPGGFTGAGAKTVIPAKASPRSPCALFPG